MGLGDQPGCHRVQKINPKSCTVPLLTKLFERTKWTLGRCCSAWRLFEHQEVERTHPFPSLSHQSQSRGSHAQRTECGPEASSPGGEINEVQQKGQQEFREYMILSCWRKLYKWFLTDYSIPGFRDWRKQLHSERFIKNPHLYTNKKYYLLTGQSVNGHKGTVLHFQTD